MWLNWLNWVKVNTTITIFLSLFGEMRLGTWSCGQLEMFQSTNMPLFLVISCLAVFTYLVNTTAATLEVMAVLRYFTDRKKSQKEHIINYPVFKFRKHFFKEIIKVFLHFHICHFCTISHSHSKIIHRKIKMSIQNITDISYSRPDCCQITQSTQWEYFFWDDSSLSK